MKKKEKEEREAYVRYGSWIVCMFGLLVATSVVPACATSDDEASSITVVNSNSMTEYVDRILIREVVDGTVSGTVVEDTSDLGFGGERTYDLDPGTYYVHIRSGPPLEGFWFTTGDNYLKVGAGEEWIVDYDENGGHIDAP